MILLGEVPLPPSILPGGSQLAKQGGGVMENHIPHKSHDKREWLERRMGRRKVSGYLIFRFYFLSLDR